MDNALSHKTKLIRAWFAKRRRWQFTSRRRPHSWINQVERFFVLLSEQQIKLWRALIDCQLEACDSNTYSRPETPIQNRSDGPNLPTTSSRQLSASATEQKTHETAA